MDIIKYTLEECEDILCRIRDGSIDDVDRVRVIEQMLKNGADKNDILERVGNLELALERKVSNSNNGLELVRMQMVRINNIGEYELSSEVKNKLSSIDGLLDNIGRLVKLEERIEMMAKPMARIERHSEIRRITGHSPNYRSDINDDIVLKMHQDGLSNAEIARRLNTNSVTIKNRLKHKLKKENNI